MRALLVLLAALLLTPVAEATPMLVGEGPFGFNSAGRMPKKSTPPTCTNSRKGQIYYDTDDNTFQGCNATKWASLGTTITGFTDGGVPAAGAGGDMWEFDATVLAMDGSDTINALFIDITNANHTGSTNLLNGINIDGITGDAQADEFAISVGDGWDRELVFIGDSAIIEGGATTAYVLSILDGASGVVSLEVTGATSTKPTMTAKGHLRTDGSQIIIDVIPATMVAMNGSDTYTGIAIDLPTAAHTGVTNVLNGILVETITGEAQARETGIQIEDGWDIGISSVGSIFTRQEFEEPIREVESDYTAKLLSDASVNLAIGHGGILFEYREELGKTASSIIFDGTGGLDISADNTVDNEGVEIYLGSSQNTTTGYLLAQTDQMCFSVNVTVALIAGTDQFIVGWRVADAYQDINAYLSYSDYAVVGINNTDGSVFGLSDSTTGAAESDDSTTNWADTETKTLKSCVDGAGLVHAYLDGTLVVETNRTTALDSNKVLNPFISYMQAGGVTDAGIIINWWEITAN